MQREIISLRHNLVNILCIKCLVDFTPLQIYVFEQYFAENDSQQYTNYLLTYHVE